MARDSYLNGRAYLLTNRVTFGPIHDVGIGGRTVQQMVQASVRLERVGATITAELVQTGEKASVTIGRSGVD
jgi:hypothetical protein